MKDLLLLDSKHYPSYVADIKYLMEMMCRAVGVPRDLIPKESSTPSSDQLTYEGRREFWKYHHAARR